MHDEDVLYLSVSIPVVLAEIDFIFYQLYGFRYHDGGMFVVADLVVAAVVGEVVAHRDGTGDVEGEVELSVAGIEEVVVDGACVDIVRITFYVE